LHTLYFNYPHMKKKIFFLIFFNCLIFNSFSQNNNIADSVKYLQFIDQVSNKPLSYTIVLKNNKVVAISNENGFVNLSLIECDSGEVLISRYGYEKQLINCEDLKNKKKIKLNQEDNVLNTVEVRYQEDVPLFTQLKKQKKQKYFAQYYFKLKIFNDKHRQIFIADIIANVYDTGKDNKFPYKIQFVSKRISKLKSKKFHFNNNEINIEKEVALLIWQNKSRNKNYYTDNKYKVRTKKVNDTTLIYFHRKNDAYVTNNTHVKVFNDTVCYFDNEYIMRESLIEIYKSRYESKKKDKTFLPISKSYFYYVYNTINFSNTEKYSYIPSKYRFYSKFDQLNQSKTIKYNTFYIEKTMVLIKELDIKTVKKVKFSKAKKLNYEPIDTLPSTHPYLDTIPFPKQFK